MIGNCSRNYLLKDTLDNDIPDGDNDCNGNNDNDNDNHGNDNNNDDDCNYYSVNNGSGDQTTVF